MTGLRILGLFLIAGFLQCAGPKQVEHASSENTYFIDPVTGNDSHTGKNKSEAWKTFQPVNQLKLLPGDRVEVLPGSFKHSLIIDDEGTPEAPITVHFSKGRYDFFPDSVFRDRYNISNTNASPDSLKSVGILIEQAKHVRLWGEEAEIIYRGKMIEVCINSSQNISISGFHFDYHRPTVSEFKVLSVTDDYVDLQIHKDSKYRIEDGNLIWYGEGWVADSRMLGQELNPETNDVHRLWNPIEEMQFEGMGEGIIRGRGEHQVREGHIYQLRETFRDYAAVFTRRSKDISWKDIHFYFLHGMGMVSQFSENLTFDSVSIAPRIGSGRTTAAWADMMHFSGCKGKILVNNCIFNGAHDDAINIHGTYLRIVEKISERQLKVRFVHHQTYGFMAFNPGDEIEFVDHESYKSRGLNKVLATEMIDPKEILLTLEKEVPQNVKLHDVIENVTWTPEVEIRGNRVFRIPTRGFLVSSRRKVLIEENEFIGTHMSAILVAIDANNWFESGYVRDMTIRNNKFIRCAEPVMLIEPRNEKSNDCVHQNIHIENNMFVLRKQLVLRAKSTKNITLSGNTIISEDKLNNENIIETSDCTNVKASQNKYPLSE